MNLFKASSNTFLVAVVIAAALFAAPSTVSAIQTTDGNKGPAKYSPVQGELHPDFLLPNIDDEQPTRLSDYRGKKVLLVHFASW